MQDHEREITIASSTAEHGSAGDAMQVFPSCGCGCSGIKPESAVSTKYGLSQVYSGGEIPPLAIALGRLGFDFDSEAKRDSLQVRINPANISVPDEVAGYFQTGSNLPSAASFIWTVLGKNGVPVCAIQPQGPFTETAYENLIEFLVEQEIGTSDEPPAKMEYVVFTGFIVGRARLALGGVIVPVIQPDLEGMTNFDVPSIVNSAIESLSNWGGGDPTPVIARARQDFLEVLYDKVVGLAITPPERAEMYVSYDVTPILQQFFGAALAGYVLEASIAGPSEVSPTGRNYQNVTLSFFDPVDATRATISIVVVVDVTDVNPRLVTVRNQVRTRSAAF